MTRILAVTNLYPPQHLGGYELLCRDVMTRLAGRGHEVEVLCGDPELQPGAPEDDPTVAVHRELKLYWRDEEPWSAPLDRQLAIERHNQAVLTRVLERFRPDVVSPWHMAAVSLNLLTTVARRRLPMVFGICDEWPIFATDLDPWSGHWQSDPIRRQAGRLIERFGYPPAVLPDLGSAGPACFISDFTRRVVRQSGPWYFREAPVVAAGVDRIALHVPDLPAPRPWTGRLAYFGRFDRRKGTHTLLSALALMPATTTLTLYGRGGADERRHLLELARSSGVAERVHIASLDRHALVAAYQEADCVVFPSEWGEPFGLIPLEAMECGTPVVATGVGGSADYLRDGINCVLFPPGDPQALAAAVGHLALDVDLRERIRVAGRATAETFDVQRMADGYEFWIGRAAGRTAGRHVPVPAGWQRSNPLGRHQSETEDLLWASGADTGPDAVKRLYQTLGDDWWNLHSSTDGPSAVPVLSLPETADVVVPRLTAVRGLVLDAGCGPTPVVAISVGRSAARSVVALDIGLGTVRVGREQAARSAVDLIGVVGDVEHLPFRDRAFAGLVCDDTLEHLPNDRMGAAELARVLALDGVAVIATPNRHNVFTLRARLADRWRGRRRALSYYFVSNSHLREYSWKELASLLSPWFELTARLPVGWRVGRKRKLMSHLLVGPAHRLSQMIVVEGHPHRGPADLPR